MSSRSIRYACLARSWGVKPRLNAASSTLSIATTSAEDEPSPEPGGTSLNITISMPSISGCAFITASGSGRLPVQARPVTLWVIVAKSSDLIVTPGLPVGRSMQRTYLSIVQLSTLPPCSSGYGLTSVPPPKKPMRMGAFAL